MAQRGSRRDAGAAKPALARYLAQVLIATALVGVCPIVIVWWLRSSGALTAYLPGMALGVGLSLGAAYVGRAFWQTRPGSQHLLFSELMIWGFVHRCYTERRLASARAVLGTMNHAQDRIPDGLSADDQIKLLEQMARGMDARDPNTHGHSRRVARYAWMIATRLGLPREEVARIRTAAAIHDLGKIETPDSILRKEGPLSDAEYETMKRHAADGARMAAALNDEGLTAMIRHHHERLDGTGYPDRLAGEAIPIGARIIAVADTFDSITANRPYRAARPHKEALDILMGEAGKQLDRDAVRAFCGHYSGRRALTFWASLATLPERAIAQLSSGMTGVVSVAKVLAGAALIGGVAATTATLAHAPVPTHRGHGQPQVVESAVRFDSEQAALPTAPSGAPSPTVSQPRAHAPRRRSDARGGGSDAASSGGSPGETTSVSQSSQSSEPSSPPGRQPGGQEANGKGEEQPKLTKSKVKSEGAKGTLEETSGKDKSEEGKHNGGREESKRKSEDGKGKPEESKGRLGGKVEEAKGKVEGAVEGVKGKVEGTVEGVDGKVEGTVEGVKGKVEETTGKVVEVTGKVEGKVEEVTHGTAGKVEEVAGATKGKVEKIIGKL